MRCVTWDQDCAGQLVLLSLDPREVERTVPWPSGVSLVDVRWVTRSDDQVWLFADALWMFEAGRWQRFEWPYDSPRGLVADPAGDGVWVAVESLGLLHVSADAARLYHPRDSLYALPVARGWTPIWKESPGVQLATLSLAETADGRIWAGTDGGGLWVYDEAEAVWQPTELTQAFVDALQGDEDGGLWIGTRYGGIAHYDGQDGWQWWRTYDGLPSDEITALALDQRGRVWAGTADAGLIRFDGQAWGKLEIDGVEPGDRITPLVADGQGSVYFGHGLGVGVCHVAGCTPHLPGESPSHRIGAMALDQSGDLWASDGYLLYAYSSRDGWSWHRDVQVFVGELLLDSRGWLWAGGYGLSTYRSPGRAAGVAFPDDTYQRVYGLLEDSHGRIWVARGHGVSMYDPALDRIGE
jgi:ligand-binding sensor domain-containing protein